MIHDPLTRLHPQNSLVGVIFYAQQNRKKIGIRSKSSPMNQITKNFLYFHRVFGHLTTIQKMGQNGFLVAKKGVRGIKIFIGISLHVQLLLNGSVLYFFC